MNAKQTADTILEFARTVKAATGKPVNLLEAWQALQAAKGLQPHKGEDLVSIDPEYGIPGAAHRVRPEGNARPANRLYPGGQRTKTSTLPKSLTIVATKADKLRNKSNDHKSHSGPAQYYLDEWITKTLSRSRVK